MFFLMDIIIYTGKPLPPFCLLKKMVYRKFRFQTNFQYVLGLCMEGGGVKGLYKGLPCRISGRVLLEVQVNIEEKGGFVGWCWGL